MKINAYVDDVDRNVILKIFNEKFKYKNIEVLNLFASGKEPFMNARYFARDVVDKYDFNMNVNNGYKERAWILLENLVLEKAKELSKIFDKNKNLYQTDSFTDYQEFIKKYKEVNDK